MLPSTRLLLLCWLVTTVSISSVYADAPPSVYRILQDSGNHVEFLKMISNVALPTVNHTFGDLLAGAVLPPGCDLDLCQVMLLAPTDAAVEETVSRAGLSIDLLDTRSQYITSLISTYHLLIVRGGRLSLEEGLMDTAAQLRPDAPFLQLSATRNQSANTSEKKTEKDGGDWLVTDGAGVTHSLAGTELRASNGVVRVLDSGMLLPFDVERLRAMVSPAYGADGASSVPPRRREMLTGDTFNGTVFEYVVTPRQGYSVLSSTMANVETQPTPADLKGVLSSESVVIFVPSDARTMQTMAKIQDGVSLISLFDASADVLLYHIHLGALPEVPVGQNVTLTMANGEEAVVENTGENTALPVNAVYSLTGLVARVVDYMKTSNGEVYSLDLGMEGSKFFPSLKDRFWTSDEHSILKTVFEATDLEELVKGLPFTRQGPAWLLAPTNAAFEQFLEDMDLDLQMMVGPPVHPYMKEVLEYHMWAGVESVTDEVRSMEMRNGDTITLKSNSTLDYDVVTDISGNEHWLHESSFLSCRNGHFISISSVMVPSQPFSRFNQTSTSSPTRSVSETTTASAPPTPSENFAARRWTPFTAVLVALFALRSVL